MGKIFAKENITTTSCKQLARLNTYTDIHIYIETHSKTWASDLTGHFSKEGIEKVIHQMRRCSA